MSASFQDAIERELECQVWAGEEWSGPVVYGRYEAARSILTMPEMLAIRDFLREQLDFVPLSHGLPPSVVEWVRSGMVSTR